MVTITSFAQAGGTLTALYWLPVWFQAIKDTNGLQSGTGHYLLEVIVGNALVAVGAGLTSTFSPTSSLGEIIEYQILMGVRRGFVLQLLVTAMQANVLREDASIATAYAMFSQLLGGAFFSAIAKTIFTSSIAGALEKSAPGVDPSLLTHTGVTP
ncbi:hypothetical protein F4818DRAFT_444764 [Hypoxylon cercidicola]|nr:hypothetical protein F4818DRAFT_444764 [Hypoxylon cercidicola]